MKIRNGFVSNSSSSSFLIKTDGDYNTVYDVAKRMMLDMQSDRGEDWYTDELIELETVKDKDTPVFFDSYDGGYIRKFKDVIIVSTSQHYDSSALDGDMVQIEDLETGYFKELEYTDEDLLEDGYDGIRRIEDMEDFDYYWSQFNDFLLLKSGLYGVWYYDFDNIISNDGCNCGSYSFVKLKNGKRICRCKATKKYARKIKLEEIEKHEN